MRAETAHVSSDIAYWLALVRTPGIGPAAVGRLLSRFSSPKAVFDAGHQALAACGLTADTLERIAEPDWKVVEGDLDWLAQPGNHVLTVVNAAYPALLKEIPDPPPLLFVHGHLEALRDLQLAVVGSRNPTAGGAEIAYEFARYLARSGLTITSGLALGVDAEAHRGALAGDGTTVAVTATGLDRVYPARHRDLAHAIAERGALVSEFPPGVPALPENFPRRNRIISGLSLGTLVVEAALRSGSLITARHALEQGREVFAIPGSIHNPLARGCHRLIREGAKLVETADDIMEELGPLAGVATFPSPQGESRVQQARHSALDDDHERVLEALGYDPMPVDRVVERSGLTAEAVSSMLLVLELHGLVASSAGGLYTRVTERG